MSDLIKIPDAADSSYDTAFTVEFNYMIKGQTLVGSTTGGISIEFPYCDIPINRLFVEVYLPFEFKFGECK